VLSLLVAWPLAMIGMAGCGAPAATDSGTPGNASDRLSIGCYSVVREVVHDGLLPAFAAQWKARTGREVRFEESYNASGAQARAIVAGLDADVAILSHEGDMASLVKAGRVDANWQDNPHRGMITRSLVVIGVRPGNPRQIQDWADLARPGTGVLYPDPKTSGGARWNINAIYGAAYLGETSSADSKKPAPDANAARDLLARVQANVVNMDPSGRQSMANFERGTGDAVVTYENEILLRRREGADLPYVIPRRTLLIEGPAALVESSVKKHGNRPVAEAFLAFLTSDEGQTILARYGFRPIKEGVAAPTPEPLPAGLFTMADLGGWPRIEKELYGPQGVWMAIFTSPGARR
jgi:sulfate transport system substrate-binding protein